MTLWCSVDVRVPWLLNWLWLWISQSNLSNKVCCKDLQCRNSVSVWTSWQQSLAPKLWQGYHLEVTRNEAGFGSSLRKSSTLPHVGGERHPKHKEYGAINTMEVGIDDIALRWQTHLILLFSVFLHLPPTHTHTHTHVVTINLQYLQSMAVSKMQFGLCMSLRFCFCGDSAKWQLTTGNRVTVLTGFELPWTI